MIDSGTGETTIFFIYSVSQVNYFNIHLVYKNMLLNKSQVVMVNKCFYYETIFNFLWSIFFFFLDALNWLPSMSAVVQSVDRVEAALVAVAFDPHTVIQ